MKLTGGRSSDSAHLTGPPTYGWYHSARGRSIPWPESAGQQFERLVNVMRTLRSPAGLPWDREQTLLVAAAVCARGNLRAARHAGSPRSAGPARGAWGLPVRGRVSRADCRGGRPLLHRRRDSVDRRQTRAAPPARVHARRPPARRSRTIADRRGGRREMGGPEGQGTPAQATRPRKPRSAASRARCLPCCARTSSAHAPRQSASTG